MAAFHWEARRRQIMLDRRLALQAIAARERQKYEEAAAETSQKKPNQPCPDPESQHLAPVKEELSLESYQRKEGSMESRCTCNTQHVPNHSGKLLKRYSDSEYTQQW